MGLPTNFLFDNQVTPDELKQLAARLTSAIRALAGNNLERKMLKKAGEVLSSQNFIEGDEMHVSWGLSLNKTAFEVWLFEIRAAKAAKKRGTKKCKKA